MDTFRVRATESADIGASAMLYVLQDREDGTLPPYFVIASAVDEALRSMKFQPAPSEMLELCCQANNKLSNAIGTVERLDEIRHEAALIADATLGQELTAPPYVHQVLPRLWKPHPPAAPPRDPPYDKGL